MSNTSATLARTSAAIVVVLGVLLLHSLPMTHPPGGHDAGPGLDSATIADQRHDAAATTMSHHVAPAKAVVTLSSATVHTSDMAMGMCMAIVTIVAAAGFAVWFFTTDEVPADFTRMTPYVATLFVLAFAAPVTWIAPAPPVAPSKVGDQPAGYRPAIRNWLSENA